MNPPYHRSRFRNAFGAEEMGKRGLSVQQEGGCYETEELAGNIAFDSSALRRRAAFQTLCSVGRLSGTNPHGYRPKRRCSAERDGNGNEHCHQPNAHGFDWGAPGAPLGFGRKGGNMQSAFRKNHLRVLLSLWCLVVGASSSTLTVCAQTYQGGLRGAVHDAAGAVIPAVEITLTNEETNTVRSTVTNDVGEYSFPNVPPGTYTVAAAKPGFKKFDDKGVRIGTQSFITLDVSLEVGQISEQIVVTGEAPLIESSNASVGSTLEKKQLETLPTPARNVFFLSVITPNVVPSGDPQFVRQQDQTNSSLLSLGGGPRRANNYTVDGVSITDLRNRAVFIPNIEAVEEVKVQVSTYDAEMGRTGGGVFNTTGKSGTNNWHGSGLFQNRPPAASSNFFFARQANLPKPDNYYYLYGGSVGGPIVHDRTFFWATTEGYKTKTSRNAVLILPTERERAGDFSQSAMIFDPLTTRPDPDKPGRFIRDPFPGGIIPGDRINNVAKAVDRYWPKPVSGNTATRTAELVDRATQLTGKIDHRFSGKLSTSGMYASYDSKEPESRFYGRNLGDNPADPGEGALFRTVHMVAINNTLVSSPSTVFALRYGYTRFKDNDVPIAFDPATLGFSQNFFGAIPYRKFPRFTIGALGSVNFDTFGDRDPQDTYYYSHGVDANVSKLIGRHTLKIGGDWRIIGMRLFARGQPSGRFAFDKGFTQGPDPLVATTNAGSEMASFLLGFPASGDITVGSPNDFYINYYAGYVHDDFRVSPKLTVNLGLRYEFEQGLKERDNHITVGFDRQRAFPVQAPGLNLKGGLMYAGVDGYQTNQSDPSVKKFAPRVGFAWTMESRTVLRGGYGIFYAPNQYAFPNENRLGTRGFTAVTSYFASADGGLTPCSTCTLTNPFPNGIEKPVGSALGLLTGAGGTLNFVDQFRKSAYVHQYSVELQRELARQIVVSVGYVGSRSENLSLGGTNSNTVNINQVDPRSLSLGSALLASVDNPMFGNAAFGALGRQRTVPRGQLLRPYPQFLDVLAHQVSAGFARYNSLVLQLKKRSAHGWGADINYTSSMNKDNLFGEVNYFSNNSNGLARALNNYDLNAEYAPSVVETPHRLNISGIYELPFGRGKRWVSGGGVADVLIGGWSISGIGSYQSGFPSVIVQNNNNSGLFGSFQRPNLVAGANPASPGSRDQRLNGWFNKDAWTEAAPFTFGNAPRTDTRVRTPFKKNWDIAFQKTQRLSERVNLLLRAEIINAFDDPNFLGPATRFGRSDFGQITQVGGFPRLLQVMARVQW